MALGEAILVCLAEAPLSGYELAKTFDTSIGFFWHADHQQIYRELRRLKERGWVTGELVQQQGRPNKSLYSITADGRARLLEWSLERTGPASIKDDMMVKLYALDHVDLPAVQGEIRERLDGHRRRLRLYQRIHDSVYAAIAPDDRMMTGRLLGLRLGMQHESGWVDWCEATLATLDRFADPAQLADPA